jgi:hypothetical protein
LVLSRSDNVTIFVIIINKMNKLKQRWGIETNFQLTLSLSFFALTGSASAWLSKPLYWLWHYERRLGYWFCTFDYLIFLFINCFWYRFSIWAIQILLNEKILKRFGFGFLFKLKASVKRRFVLW